MAGSRRCLGGWHQDVVRWLVVGGGQVAGSRRWLGGWQ